MAHVAVDPNDKIAVLIEKDGFDDHFHDHHHGDKFQSNFLTHYIFSTDHKMIARQFLITGIIWALLVQQCLLFSAAIGFSRSRYGWIKPFLANGLLLKMVLVT